MAYSHPAYRGQRNYPEIVTDAFLTCRICSVPGLKQPKMLPVCGHTFCKPCIEEYLGLGPNDERGGFMFACPICKTMNKMPQKGGISGLPNNLFADTQIDRLLRRHNKERGRDDARYNIHDYTQAKDTLHASFPVAGQKIYKDLPY